MSNLEGIDYLRTKSMPNASVIIANLKYGTDLNIAIQDTQRYIDNIRKKTCLQAFKPVMSRVSQNDLPSFR
ncbi:MAG: efflux RND transporter permease subunit [Bacteroidales bacterium]|nr:efflux RND transporter permease subunit [Bacteroidales bacterium]